MKYNAAVLRSRRIQKQISERSLSSLHGRHMHSEYGQPAHHRLTPDTADCQHRGAKSYREPVIHAKESTHGTDVPSDRRHHYPKPATGQNKAKISAVASRTDVGKVSQVSSRSQNVVTPHVRTTERTESDKAMVKWSPEINASGVVTSAVGVPLYTEQAPQLLLACGNNTDDIEIYATLRRKSRPQKTVQPHSPEASSSVHQRSSRPGILNPPSYVQGAYDQAYPESRHARRWDKTPLPPHDSLSRLKISWLVLSNYLRAFVSLL